MQFSFANSLKNIGIYFDINLFLRQNFEQSLMESEIVNSQHFCETICQHISTINPLDFNIFVGYQFANIVVLNIDVFGGGLAFNVFHQDDTCFIIPIEDIDVDWLYKAQLVEELPDLHTFSGDVF